MEFTREEYQVIAAAFVQILKDGYFQFLPCSQMEQEQKTLLILRRIQNHLIETAFPAIPIINRDENDEIWA